MMKKIALVAVIIAIVPGLGDGVFPKVFLK